LLKDLQVFQRTIQLSFQDALEIDYLAKAIIEVDLQLKWARSSEADDLINLMCKERKGQVGIREKVKEDENGIGIAGARSLSSEAGEGAGVANKQGGS
jgi:hypothetical protein